MTEHSPSTGPADQDNQLCPWCNARLRFHSPYALSRHAFFQENRAEALIAASQELLPETRVVLLPADGSSYRTRGDSRSRTWSATGLSATASRRLKAGRSGSTCRAGRSTAGLASIRTSDSSKSSTVEVVITGQEGPTHADEAGVRRAGHRRRLTDRMGDAGAPPFPTRTADKEEK
jgi:hypothetical protein